MSINKQNMITTIEKHINVVLNIFSVCVLKLIKYHNLLNFLDLESYQTLFRSSTQKTGRTNWFNRNECIGI